MDLSLVVCTRNRRARLTALLDGLRDQRAPVAWEVLVVDNASDDGTAEAVERQVGDFPVPLRLAREPRWGISHARNRGLDEARGRLAVFVDDDVTCHPGFVAAHRRAFASPDVVATAGRVLPRLPQAPPARLDELFSRAHGGPTSRYDLGDAPLEIGGTSGRPLPVGANMGLRRDAARAAGGFREDLGWARERIPGEEEELCRRIAGPSQRLLYVPDACVDHHIEAERLDERYVARWYRGQGRATVLIDPPSGPVDRARLALVALRKATVWELRRRRLRSRSDDVGYARALRKAAKTRGRLAQLLAPGPER